MTYANDNRRPNYKRPKMTPPPPREKRTVYAWEIDSSLDPSDEKSWEVIWSPNP